MATEQNKSAESPDESGKEAPQSRGAVHHVMKLMGRTVGFAQKSGRKTGRGISNAGSKLRSRLRITRKEKGGSSAIEEQQGQIRGLYVEIGERVCALALENSSDGSFLIKDARLESLISAVRERAEEIRSKALRSAAAERDEAWEDDPEESVEGDEYFEEEKEEKRPSGEDEKAGEGDKAGEKEGSESTE